MTLPIGTKLGPYEIVASIGSGGMGEVYKARDTRLERVVAIKVLPESMAKDSARLTRFQQEARALSALNHPNLLAIFDVGAENGTNFIVSEYLEGQTLRERLEAGPLPCRKAAEVARQVVIGMAAAHEKGIVHRDLKPDNIFLTRDDHAKILDFGLAKHALGGDGAFGGTLTGLTMTGPTMGGPALTAPGSVMGTVGYMSPEQVRGQTVDYRSDIFSFGAILYEMVTGKRAFTGDSAIETMNAILKSDVEEIDPSKITASPGIAPIVRHCSEKNPADRFQSARDLGFALGALSGTETRPAMSGSGAVAAIDAKSAGKWEWVWKAAAGVLGAAFLVMAWSVFHKSASEGQQVFAIATPGEVNHLALSADGKWLAYTTPDEESGKSVLVIQKVGTSKLAVLKGTEGASYPFWSPDNKNLGFFADGKLKKIGVNGGGAETLALTPNARGGSWGSKGVILYTPQIGSGIWRINPDGTHDEQVTEQYFLPEESSHRWPVFLPDGEHFLFWGGSFANADDDPISWIYEATLDGKERKKLVQTHSNPGYANGELLYLDKRGSLVATKLDTGAARVGEEKRVIADVVGFQASTYWGAFTAAENGTVVYNSSAGSTLSALTWFDRAGQDLGQVGEVGVLANPSFSPDDQFVAVDRTDLKARNVDVWINDLKRGTASRFTFDPAEDVSAAWSRDGQAIAYRSAAGSVTVDVKKFQGTEKEKVVLEQRAKIGRQEFIPNSWSADNAQILCTAQFGRGEIGLATVASNGSGDKEFLRGKASYANGQISPDGKWVAYQSNETGDWEVYVTTFPGASGKWQVSRGGGTEPRWRGDGKEMFYIGPHGELTAVEVNSGGSFSAGVPMKLFPFHGRAQISSTDLSTYDVTKDGKKFIVNRYVRPANVAPLTVVLNAGAEGEK
jgi:Tol biopolymer transport system component